MRRRDIAVALAAIAAVAALFATPALDRLDALSLDVLHLLRHRLAPPAARESPTVVVALDEETYRTPPFRDTPKVMWTPEIGRTLGALVEAGATVVGFDLILPTSLETRVPGFDRPFLLALRAAARSDKVVLGKVQHSDRPVAPFAAQVFAVGGARNLRATNLVEDSDGVIRRVPLLLTATGAEGDRREPSLPLELALRSSGRELTTTPQGLRIGGTTVPGGTRNALAVNFDTRRGAIPVLSFADIDACIRAGRSDFLAAQVAGKAVLIGSVLDVEDRKITSARFATAPDPGAGAPRCVLPVESRAVVAGARDTLPGVLVLANAVNNLVRGDGLVVVSPLAGALYGLPVLAAAGGAVLVLAPLLAAAATLAAMLVWTGAATAAFAGATALPLLDPILGAALVLLLLTGYRVGVVDRDKRFLRRVFGLYLAPAVIDRLVRSERPPTLGGETRELTVLFSDLAKFSTISEGLSPEALVRFMNAYLSAMTDIIEAHGGFVDKYIGDAIVAVFGAPLDDPEHAAHAVTATLACHAALAAMQTSFGLPGNPPVVMRVGLNTGDMLVGNIGSSRRFNYTVMGDAVNLAAQLEGANKAFGTTALVSEDTVRRAGNGFAFRELDAIQVVGRSAGVRVFEPLGPTGDVSPAQRDLAERYGEALAAYRARRFADAAALLRPIADGGDGASAALLARCDRYAADPPPSEWTGVTALEAK